MKVIKTERIVKTFYDALEMGKVLGRKCCKCGHIEFPPYLACNECGNLDTEWVDLTNVRAHVKQMLRPLTIFPETEFKEANGGYIPIAVQIDGADPVDSSLVHVSEKCYDELHDHLEDVIVKPWIIQGEDTKLVVWVLEDYSGIDMQPADRKIEDVVSTAVSEPGEGGMLGMPPMAPPPAAAPAPAAAPVSGAPAPAAPVPEVPAATAGAVDEIAEKVIACAAEAYETDAASITMNTDVRENLSSESIRLIVMLSNIEEKLGIGIEVVEAGQMNTIADFVNAVKEKMQA